MSGSFSFGWFRVEARQRQTAKGGVEQSKAAMNDQWRRQTAEGGDKRQMMTTNNRWRWRTISMVTMNNVVCAKEIEAETQLQCPVVEAAMTTNGGRRGNDQRRRQQRWISKLFTRDGKQQFTIFGEEEKEEINGTKAVEVDKMDLKRSKSVSGRTYYLGWSENRGSRPISKRLSGFFAYVGQRTKKVVILQKEGKAPRNKSDRGDQLLILQSFEDWFEVPYCDYRKKNYLNRFRGQESGFLLLEPCCKNLDHYMHFLPVVGRTLDVGRLAEPWTQNASFAFDKLKAALTSALVLAIPNFKEPFVLEIDALGSGIGVILSQSQHPIAYFSKKLCSRKQKQSIYISELYVITEALTKFRHYLLGHKFIVKTDQKSLKELLKQKLQTLEQQ
ncbi:hypothetical protein V8G54_012690 [Vigna mungo]|uniref:Reverse transcriptase/retrotransposon-derived protein RNase H-like domain-containing protein n=1 Tax=Vigna mungo TaxID=3915 RepID=A0AAQ3S497_VIGMU